MRGASDAWEQGRQGQGSTQGRRELAPSSALRAPSSLGRAPGLRTLLRTKPRSWAAVSLRKLALEERPGEVPLGGDATSFQHGAWYSSERQ